MAKYKIGQKVRILRIIPECAHDQSYNKFIGKVVTISHIQIENNSNLGDSYSVVNRKGTAMGGKWFDYELTYPNSCSERLWKLQQQILKKVKD